MSIDREDLEAAKQGFSPAAAWGTGQLGSQAGGLQGWQDVGGLQEVREALRETLELPAKHPKLFAMCAAAPWPPRCPSAAQKACAWFLAQSCPVHAC